MSTFLCNIKKIFFKISKSYKSINAADRSIIEILRHVTITSILLLFHLLISSIKRINPFRGCSHYLEAIQVIYNANRFTGFSVMGVSVERNI